jgi:SpoVK/Ycf46/Vps4 family AAA+-type ATPase
VLAGREALPPQDRPLVRLEVPATSFEERLQLWEETLGDLPRPTADELGTLAAQFRGDASVVRGAVAELRAARNAGDEPAPGVLLWAACRSQARPRLGTLAQRVISDVQLRDVILPETQRRMLDAVLVQVRHKARVHHEWGFAAGESRGQGVSAVFAGPSGTGKTMAAEAIARELSLDLYRVDLSSVVSKYIGETEQNLRRVFDAAEAGGGVLLFDEADALFGKRTEVKDSHDRHANIEVSYLLQRMEAYGGLAILTTNLRKNMDDAFFRRIPFVIDFPFPDSELREQIWRGIFPASAPVEGILYPKLAQLPVAGGNIRSIARNAAFLGAADGGRITMKQLLEATRLEYAKLGRSLPPEEIRGWV